MSKTIKTSLILVLLAAVLIGVFVFFSAKKEREERKSDQYTVTSGKITGGELSPEISSEDNQSSTNKINVQKSAKPVKASAISIARDLSVKTYQPPAEVYQVRKQLDDILRTNKIIQTTTSSQASQITKIRDQTVIHQRILSELDASSLTQKLTRSDQEEILRQEKIRIIKQQADTNQEYLTNIGQVDAS